MSHYLGSWIVHLLGLSIGMVLGYFLRDWIADVRDWAAAHRGWFMERRP